MIKTYESTEVSRFASNVVSRLAQWLPLVVCEKIGLAALKIKRKSDIL